MKVLNVVSALAVVVISVASGFYVQPLISGNDNAVNTIVTVFSILAGFLVAVITFIGDPGARGWKELQLDKRGMLVKLNRHKALFYLYLVTLGLALSMFVVPKENCLILLWLERAFVCLTTFVFLMSFTLPQSLMELQQRRYEDALDEQLPEVLRKLSNKERK